MQRLTNCSPAKVVHDDVVDGLVLTAARISQHVAIVAVVLDVLVLGNEMHVENTDVHS